jgi:hypothetical protein
MSVTNGPNDVLSGLVFYYDANNTKKSWLGAPTTNLLSNSDSFNGGSWGGYCAGNMNNATFQTTDVPAPDGSFNALKIVRDSGTSCGGSGTWGMLWGAGNVTAGTTYTISMWAMAPTTISGVGFMFNDAGGTSITLTPTWQRFTYTAVLPNPGNGLRGLQFIMPPGSGTAYFWGAQLEASSVASAYTSTSTGSGTRSTTQALVDLTRKNTITANSLTYNSDGTFSFNGSSNYMSVTGGGFTSGMSAYSIMHWSRRDVESRMPIAGLVNTNFYQYGDNSWRYTHGGTGGEYYYPHAVSIPVGTWGFYCIVYDGSNVNIYRNGVFEGQQATTGSADWSQGLMIGYWPAGGSYAYQGKIDAVSFYNRALSASEVLQNFNALRGRYGI